jgi:hypothetical protein
MTTKSSHNYTYKLYQDVSEKEFITSTLKVTCKMEIKYQADMNSVGECIILIRLYTGSMESCDSSVSIALGYGLDNRGSRVRFLAGDGNFSLHHHIQNGAGAHPASYPMGTKGSFPGGKAAGA